MRQQDVNNTLKAGSFVAGLLILTMGFVMMIGGHKSAFKQKVHLKTIVENAENLKPGAAILYKGINIGTVDTIEVRSLDKIEINFDIVADYREWVKQDSYVSIKTQGLLGDKFLEILGGSSTSPPVQEGAALTLQGGPEISEFINKGDDILVISKKVLAKLDSVLDQVSSDGKLEKTVGNLERSTSKLDLILQGIPSKKLGQSLSNLENITQQISKGPGSLHSLIYDDAIYQDLRTLLGGAQRSKMLKYFIRESIKKSEKIED